jgi:hypothetical protein
MESARKVPDEVRQILVEVCAEYRVRIDPDDPAVAVVMLNRLALELALNRAIERIEATTAALHSQVEAAQVRIGGVVAQELRSALHNAEKDQPRANPPSRRVSIDARTLTVAAAAGFLVGLLAGFLLR